jgi:hypothetical protein
MHSIGFAATKAGYPPHFDEPQQLFAMQAPFLRALVI